MKIPFCLSLILFLSACSLQSAQTDPTDEIVAADEERMAATIASDSERLDAIYSDELRYAHSSGKVDDKESMIKSLTSGGVIYESFEYKERDFLVAGPGVVLMSGTVLIHAEIPTGKVVVELNFLSVWRNEDGHWRFLSWQSNKVPAE